MTDPFAAAAPAPIEPAPAPIEVPNAPAVAGASVTAPATAELPNVDAGTSPAGAAMPASTAGDLPNVASAAGDPTADQASAPSADGAATTSPTAASSGEISNLDGAPNRPLHTQIAVHLEAIYDLARNHSVAAETAAMRTASATKTQIGDILHRISNGMSVSDGEIVAKLEALYRML